MQLDPVAQAEFDRYDEAIERVLRATSSVSCQLVPAERPDEEPDVRLSLAEYERMSRHLHDLGQLREALGKLL